MSAPLDLLRPWRARFGPSSRETWLRVGVTLFYMAIITAFSSVPGSDLPMVIPDTAAHFVEYTILGALIALSVVAFVPHGFTTRAALLTIAIGFGFALTDEFHQRFVPGRNAAFDDIAADTLGLVTAAGTLRLMLSRGQKTP